MTENNERGKAVKFKGIIMGFDEEPKSRYLMYFSESNTLYEENNPTRYQQGLDEGMIDVTDNVFYENQFKEEQKIKNSA